MKKSYKTRRLSSASKPHTGLILVAIMVAIVITAISLRSRPSTQMSLSDEAEIIRESESATIKTEVNDTKGQVSLHTPVEQYIVTKVVDGDTIDIQIDGKTQRVRLIGVNTPETVHPNKTQECFGVEASNYLKNLLNGRKVGIESDDSQTDTDIYGRLLRYVYFNETNINFAIIYYGYGYEYTYNVPYKYQAQFKEAQLDAEQNNRGLWSPSTCNGRK